MCFQTRLYNKSIVKTEVKFLVPFLNILGNKGNSESGSDV